MFPDVPFAPGVPPLPRPPGFIPAFEVVISLTSDAATPFDTLDAPQWGLFDDELNPVLLWDSVLGVEFAKDRRISDFPVEDGGFQSYNKVALPYDVRLTLAKSVSVSERANFLNDLDTLADSLTLYQVVTPEVVYSGANLTHYRYDRRQDRGANMIVAELWLQEVRVAASTTFSNTQAPSGASPVSGGAVQPSAPTSDQTSAASGGAQ